MANTSPGSLFLLLVLFFVFVAWMGSCGENESKQEAGAGRAGADLIIQTAQAQKKAEEMQARAERLMADAVSRQSELSDMQARLSDAQSHQEAAQQDFMVAAVVAFASALAALVLAEALFRERRTRTVLARFLKWLSRRSPP
jgi:hypothetical protein